MYARITPYLTVLVLDLDPLSDLHYLQQHFDQLHFSGCSDGCFFFLRLITGTYSSSRPGPQRLQMVFTCTCTASCSSLFLSLTLSFSSLSAVTVATGARSRHLQTSYRSATQPCTYGLLHDLSCNMATGLQGPAEARLRSLSAKYDE